VRVERLEHYFAKTGNIALSKRRQQPVVDYLHVLGVRAWSAGTLAVGSVSAGASKEDGTSEPHWIVAVATSTNES